MARMKQPGKRCDIARAGVANRRWCGDSVGYGATFTAARDMTIGIVGLGYGDGLLRSLGNRDTGIARLMVNNTPAAYRAHVNGHAGDRPDRLRKTCRPMMWWKFSAPITR